MADQTNTPETQAEETTDLKVMESAGATPSTDTSAGDAKPEDVPKLKPLPLFGTQTTSWHHLRQRARVTAQITSLFAFLLIAGGVAGYFYGNSRQSTAPAPTPAVTTLSADDLNKLSQVSGSLGSNGQVLNIGADALFRGKVDVSGDLSVSGHLNANGPVSLSALNITGASGTTGLTVGTNLVVGGTATFQKSLTVSDLASAANLNISGNASINSLNATSIAVRTIAISGPLTIGHLISQGAAPVISGGSVGAGGTVSISGNDTAGTVNISLGTNPGSNVVVATITFRAAYGNTTHILLTPLTEAAAASGAFVTRSAAGFQIHTRTNPTGGVLSFDYFVVQ